MLTMVQAVIRILTHFLFKESTLAPRYGQGIDSNIRNGYENLRKIKSLMENDI